MSYWDPVCVFTMSCVAIVSILRYRSRSPGATGALGLALCAVTVLLLVGLFPRTNPVFGINVSPTVWRISALGSAVCLISMLIAGTKRNCGQGTETRPAAATTSKQLSVAALVIVASLALATWNYATGIIPALAEDINAARVGGDYGDAGRLWPIIYPVMQFSVILTMMLALEKRITFAWSLLGLASLTVLVLSAGRSLYVIPFIAFGIHWVETRRPSLRTIGVLAAGLISSIGLIGLIRSQSGAQAKEVAAYLAERGLLSWQGFLDLSIQTGPRVATIAVDSHRLNGQFIVGDILNFVDSSFARSDRLVTVLVGQDESSGGMPPTIWAGFFLDFGWLGVIALGAILGFALVSSQRKASTGRLPAAIWYAYFGAYFVISSYSYVSVRPSWLTIGALCLLLSRIGKHERFADSDGVKVSENYRGRRTAHSDASRRPGIPRLDN